MRAAARRVAGGARRLGTARDALLAEGMLFHGRHGVHRAERELGQKFLVSLEARADLAAAGRSDRLGDTVSYADLYEEARRVVEGEPRDLLETVAEDVARAVLAGHAAVQSVTVEVRKPHVAVPGPVSALGVRITRDRGDL